MLLHLLDLIGVAVFAISGALAAGRRRLDLIGVVALAAVTAIGGGTIRDLLLDRHPIFWLADPSYLLVILGAALLTLAWTRVARVPWPTLDIADALGLALFSVAGSQIAERAGLPAISCVLLGTVTGAAGGVIRDVLTAQIPSVLRQGSLYATAAIAGTTFYVVLARLGARPQLASLAGMAIVAALRLAAIRWELTLPAFELRESGTHRRPDDLDR
ncbi:MAG TPA: trimeric intracellular cation channel family protein [Gemmatimonadaceae bacterium]|nr:trimeric intracellular cation channel family protein [Gemmatimonadaceae bacterium]